MSEQIQYPHCQLCDARRLSVFDKLSGEEIEELDYQKGCGYFRKNQLIFSEEAHSNGIYCINSGKIKVFKSAADGRDQIIRFAKKGDVMGYRALLSDEPYSASAMAIEDAVVCFIPRSSIIKLIEQNTRLGTKFMQLLCHNLEEAQKKIVDLSHKTVRQRLAEILLLLKETFGFEADNLTLDVRISREDLASYVGTATESLIRTLSEFKHEGLIELEGKKIKLKNIEDLIDTSGLYD